MHHFLRPTPAALLSATLAIVLLLPGCTKQHIGSTPPGARTPAEVHGRSESAAPRVEIVQSRPQPVPLTSAREEEEVVVSGNALPRPQTTGAIEEESLSGQTSTAAETPAGQSPATQSADSKSGLTNTSSPQPPAPPAGGSSVSANNTPASGPPPAPESETAPVSNATPQEPTPSPAPAATTTPTQGTTSAGETPSTPETIPARTSAPIPVAPKQAAPAYDAEGKASWISTDLQGEPTASGELYDIHSMTASHRTLPMGTLLEVTNLETGKSVEVRVNDRGPFVKERLVDVSYAAAQKLGILKKDTAKVGVRVLPPASAAAAPEQPSTVPTPLSDATPPPAHSDTVRSSAAPSTQSESPADKKAQSSVPSSAATAASDTSEQPAAPAVEPPANEQTPAPVATKAATDGAYFIQVGAFTHLDNAQRMLEHLRAQGYPGSRMVQTTRNGQPLYQVQAGAFQERDGAAEALSTLKETYPSSFLIRD